MKHLLILIFLLVSFNAKADDKLILMEQANKFYNEGDFIPAIETYETILNSGFESSALYFNLGNAYFKVNNLPMAILNFERAKKITPYDPDILFNLELANSRIVDKIEPLPEFFIFTWWKLLVNSRSLDQWATISVICFLFILLMILIFLLSRVIWLRKFGFWMGIVLIVVFAGSFTLANQRYIQFRKQAEAIVFTPTVTVKSSPRDNSTDIFVIHEGIKVQITNQVGEWFEIRIPDGSKGWIRESDFRRI
ncbi:MAG: SH3 domain-containing protein [Bacteroidales bacterium]|nr:SH3 domain-containing protein [Bacteroidales bacterium]